MLASPFTVEFRALLSDVRVELELPELQPGLRALTDCYPPAQGAPELCYRLGEDPSFQVLRDDRALGEPVCAEDLLAVLELDLYREAVRRCSEQLFHAAALVGPAVSLLLAGVSGAGKSTLALHLVEQGAHYLSDEFSAVDESARLHGLCRPISFAGYAFDGEVRAPLRQTSYPIRLAGGYLSSSVLIHPPPEQLWRGPPPVLSALCCLQSQPAEGPSWQRLPAHRALGELWPHLLRHGPGSLEGLIALLARVPCFQIDPFRPEGRDQVARWLSGAERIDGSTAAAPSVHPVPRPGAIRPAEEQV